MAKKKQIYENQKKPDTGDDIYQIFDKIFKKVITLSSTAVINLINALFDTDYPTDSAITYNWTEFEDNKLKKILADTILTINGQYSYHLEAQIENDTNIVFRVFEYGYMHADRKRIREDGKYILPFPRPVVIYLYYEGNVPDEYTLLLEFNRDKEPRIFEYKVPVLKLLDLSTKELNDRKMIILIPFHLLKLRKAIKEGNLENRMDELQSMVTDDIIGSIEANQQLGNLTVEDAFKLRTYVDTLWRYLHKHHKELEGLRDMTDESFMTEADIICEELEEAREALAEAREELAEKDSALAEKDTTLAKQNILIKQLRQELAALKEN